MVRGTGGVWLRPLGPFRGVFDAPLQRRGRGRPGRAPAPGRAVRVEPGPAGCGQLALAMVPGPQHGPGGEALVPFQMTSDVRWPAASSSGWSATGAEPRARRRRRPRTVTPAPRRVSVAEAGPRWEDSARGPAAVLCRLFQWPRGAALLGELAHHGFRPESPTGALVVLVPVNEAVLGSQQS